MDSIQTRLFFSLVFLMLAACGSGKSSQTGANSAAPDPSNSESGGPAAPAPAPAPIAQPTPVRPVPTPPPAPTEKYLPLLWEPAQKDGVLWSAYLHQILRDDLGDIFLPGSLDQKDFCTNYDKATPVEKINFWGYLISAMAKYESGFDPLLRYLENTMGTDPITKLPVFSEGLLQLSYQDIQSWKMCKFDWLKDRKLAPKDPKKTILDPFKNLHCGANILASQIRRTGKIALGRGVYWAVLKIDGRYSKLKEIQALTQSLPFCRSR